MKLATLRDGSRDGLLAVVSRDGSLAHVASGRARTLQQVLDDWNFFSPQLEDLALTLNQGKARHAFSFEARACQAPLPRAGSWAWCMGTADPEDAANATLALHFAAGNRFWGPCDEVDFPVLPDAAAPAGVAVQPGLVALCGDIEAGASATVALEGVRLLLLAARWQAGDTAERTAFAPLAVTPDELGPSWVRGRVHAQLRWQAGGQSVQLRPAEQAASWQARGFGPLLSRLAAGGAVPAGSLLGLGLPDATTGGLRGGDRLQLDCTAADGLSVFGAIQQTLAAHD